MSQHNLSLENFSGTGRLFPLPNLVLFPRVAQPLHIFEPRYRQLMADALADDRLIAMALLKPGWEEDYHQKQPPIYPVVCLGRILQEEELSDGRYNLVLHGLCRARALEELDSDRLYRIARLELMNDIAVDSETAEEHQLLEELSKGIMPFFSAHPPAMEQLRGLLQSGLPLGALSDIFGFSLPLDVEVRQQLLEEVDVVRRVRLLLRNLEGRAPTTAASQPSRRKYPPEFSSN
jgi:Lon protease-like protein